MIDLSPLWRWIREREAIRQRKDRGDPPPWTDDPILSAYRFCNVRREDDRGTTWIRKNVREPYAGHPMLWLMLCICRQINWPDSIAELIDHAHAHAWPHDGAHFSPTRMAAVLNGRKRRGDKIYTGAYMISAPPTRGSDKQTYICDTVIGDLWRRSRATWRPPEMKDGPPWRSPTLRDAHAWISGSPGWGPFMAYQAVVDMRFTAILGDAQDRDAWAAAGPGTIRGLNRLHGRDVSAPLGQDRALDEMRDIHRVSWENTGVPMDFSDVPNALCETDKYLRVMTGQGKPRAKYVPGRGS